MKKFVFANRNVDKIEVNDVGIITDEDDESLCVFFVRLWEESILERKSCSDFNVDETGDNYQNKICNVCHKIKPTEEFAINQSNKGKPVLRRPSCKSCRMNIDGVNIPSSVKSEWEKDRPHKEPFQCPVCDKRTIADVTSRVVLDHNHKTGKVRGWICDSCNTGLGRFKDDPVIARHMADYIEEKT